MSCHPAWPGVTCWHCGFQRFSCLIKELVAGEGGEHLPETYGSTLKPKPFVAAPVLTALQIIAVYHLKV